MNRRDFVAGSLLGAAVLNKAAAQEGKNLLPPIIPTHGKPHDFTTVVDLAKQLSERPYQEDRLKLNPPFADLSYDQYRGIRFRRDADPFTGHSHSFGMDLLPPGRYYQDRVRLYLVNSDNVSEEILFTPDVFDFDPNLFDANSINITDEDKAGLSWSGFRLRFPINAEEVDDEFVVFQGASYFRAVARDTLYGLSARGIAIKTGDPEGEEFPRFSRFWIHQPDAGARAITIDALLESPSVTGAYRFTIYPGAETIFNVQCTLFPCTTLEKYGIAPLTSMYYFSPTRRNNVDDYRNAVHDSDGLSMYTGRGERLWRPLANPTSLEFSAFMDNNPKGFGFIQRTRDFADFQDPEARYEKRPSAWVKPLNDWGKGHISLIEIPTDSEFNDNIICFWNGDKTLEQGKSYDFNYQLVWSQQGVYFKNRAKVVATRIGKSVNHDDSYTVSIDFHFEQPVDVESLTLKAFASKGNIPASHILRLPDSDVIRASFEYVPEKGKTAELQAKLLQNDETVTENWLYRWYNS